MVHSSLTFDVVIPAYNATSTIVEQLEAVRRNDQAALGEVLVVDSLSTDTTADLVTDYVTRWSKVRLVRAPHPGANAARNCGIRAGGSDLILLCDADDVVADDWASNLVHALSEYELVRGRYSLELLNDSDTIVARGSVGSTHPPAPGSVIDGLGGNCGFRRTAWDQLGGLSENHTGSDDVEFFWRAALEGMRVGYADDAIVNYRLRPAYKDLYRQQKSWAANRALLYKEFGATGSIQRRSIAKALRQLAWLVIRLPSSWSKDPSERGAWTRAAASAVGHLEGSARHRVWFP